MEQKFVEDIWLLLGSAHYRLLSQDEWVTALEEDFTVRRADNSFAHTNICHSGLI